MVPWDGNQKIGWKLRRGCHKLGKNVWYNKKINVENESIKKTVQNFNESWLKTGAFKFWWLLDDKCGVRAH